ncbi:choice-of-anchor Q domain-containing protein [Arachidicoccus ginsenosidivorans]|nr:choice-of-anchor Q domain-containing protein [Arachidicoccus ginsenosidivorans]
MKKRSGVFFLPMVVLVLNLLSTGSLLAKVLYVDQQATGNNAGVSWVNAYTDLQVALDAASSGDSIFVATGIYQPAAGTSFFMHVDVKAFGGFSGKEHFFYQRTLANKATLLGNGATVINNYNISAAGCWDGFIITGGNASVGGGMKNTSANITISNCIIAGNTATSGGGIENYNYAAPRITNCLFSGNKASSSGGGVYNMHYSSPTLINCTFAGNTAYTGGGIANEGHSTSDIVNCIIWGNTASYQGNSIYNSQSSASVSYSDVQDAITGAGNISVDPLFVAPGSGTAPFSGGDYRLQAGSPAIDQGSNTVNTLRIDLAGNPRVRSAVIEMGAFENTPDLKVVYVDSSIVASGDGSSWSKAFKTLSDALQGAVVDFTTVDSILVAKGTYYPTGQQNSIDRDSSFLILRSGIKVYGGYPSGGVGTREAMVNPTILSGNIGNVNDPMDNSVHVLVVAGVYDRSDNRADSVVLDGLSFNDGSTSAIAGTTKTYNGIAVLRTAGGGVNTSSNTSACIACIAFRHCQFSNNILHVSIGGGGMFNNVSSPFISYCTFSNNTGNGSGGGIFNSIADPIIDHSDFLDNDVQGSGGGIFNISGSDPLITNCLFQGNNVRGTGGAGIYNNQSNPSILNCTFTLNQTSNTTTNNTGGAGMYNLNCSPVITQCSFTGNVSAGLGGGGMFNFGGAPTITSCIFSGNRALHTSGSGAGLFSFAESAPVVTNCVFSGNYGNGISGGAALGINSATATLINCTFSGNYSTSYAAAIHSYNATADINIQNTIIWGNKAERGYPDILADASAFAVVIQNSDIQSYGGGVDGNINGDPLFQSAPLAEPNPVFGGDFSLQPGSPAINAGNTSFNGTTTDFAGNPRVFGAAIDMGAYESQLATVPVTLVDFKGLIQNGQAMLTWKTGVETGLSRFEVERSSDGATFLTVARITPKGSNSSYATSLTQTDARAFYRLKLIGPGGKFRYSDILTLTQKLTKARSVYPNPATNYIQINMTLSGRARIYNAAGTNVRSVQLAPGLNRIDISTLSAGIYFIKMGVEKISFVKK